MKKILLTTLLLVGAHAAEVSGQGFIKTNDGRVVTCAGEKVYLDLNKTNAIYIHKMAMMSVLSSKIAYEGAMLAGDSEKMDRMLISIRATTERTFETREPLSKLTSTTCDSMGNFVFNNVPVGDWKIGAIIDDNNFVMEWITVKKEDDIVRVFIVD